MKFLPLTFIWLFIIGGSVQGKQFMRCELTKILLENYKFDKTFISSWICLVEHESNRDTSKVTPLANHSKNYGLFQINSKTDCQENRKGGLCNKKCSDFTNDDISDDVACAKMLQERHGFKYWKGWQRYCYPENLPNLQVSCNLRNTSSARSSRLMQTLLNSG